LEIFFSIVLILNENRKSKAKENPCGILWVNKVYKEWIHPATNWYPFPLIVIISSEGSSFK